MGEEIEDHYIFLNIKEKIDQTFFTEKNIFFKMVNITSNKPLIQIGHHVFNGKYEDSLEYGTNLFFEEQDYPRPESIYEQQTPIHLKHIANSSKILSLHWQKVPDEIVDIDTKDLIDLEFHDNYEKVLNKIETGTLDIKDVIKNTSIKKPVPIAVKKKETHIEKVQENYEIPMETETLKPESVDENIEMQFETDDDKKYDLLKKLINKPIQDPEYQETLRNFHNEAEFLILKELYLKNLDYKKISLNVDSKNIEFYVDLEASINDGIIQNKDVNQLSENDKQLLISLENFDNLSIPMKLCLLIEHLKEEKKCIKEMSSEQLLVIDTYGRKAKDRYRLLKSIANDLHYYLYLRIRDKKLNAKLQE